MKTLFLIDANSLIHRAFHALPPFTAPDGRPTGALYGLASILLKILREEKPDYAAALFDRPEPTFREKEYPAYKAQRPKAPDELVSQIIGARELILRFGVKTFESPGFEADDLIATLAEKFRKEPDVRIVILTGDLDALQLVEGEKVTVRTPRKGVSDTFTYDEGAVMERYGLAPSQLIDYKALVGDASDNIKGVPGVGPKTASQILKTHQTLERALERAAADPKLGAKLGPWRAQIEQSKKLVTLGRGVPLPGTGLHDLRIATDAGALAQYFASLGMKTLAGRLSGGVAIPASPAKSHRSKRGGQGKLL